MTDVLPLGIYRHYKGGEYKVIGVARQTETDELLVIYRALNDPGQLWARPLAMFTETVIVNGQRMPRFTCIKPKVAL